jgi:hypothetical protein
VRALKLVAIFAALLFGLGGPHAAAMTTSPDVTVSTIAGSGAAGIADGVPGSFLMPFGVAYGANGALYVTDAAAQRVRSVDASGYVRTIAGGGDLVADGMWVRGGYRDGNRADARFNVPAGIVWYGGLLYVADSQNHCIRTIAADGTVRTLTGSPDRRGVADGPLATATFDRPTGLAVDKAGTLYVADYFGIRIVRDGAVKTIPNFGAGPFGVAVADSPTGTMIFAASPSGLARQLPDGRIETLASPEHGYRDANRFIQGYNLLGYPFAVAAFDGSTTIFTDVRGNAVRYFNWDSAAEQVVGGLDVFDGSGGTATFRDGPGDSARFDAPTGIAIAANGDVVIADAGSRRIRRLRGLDRSHDVHNSAALPQPVAAGEFRVAFVGNSSLWYFARWGDSIPGIVEQLVTHGMGAQSAKTRFTVARTILPAAPLKEQPSYVDSVLGETNGASLVVFDMNPGTFIGEGGLSQGPTPAQVVGASGALEQVASASLRATDEILRKHSIRFLVVTTPFPQDVSPAEGMWNRVTGQNGFTEPVTGVCDLMNDTARAAHVQSIDGCALFERELHSADHEALFGTQDEDHFTPHARSLLGTAIAEYILRSKPWLNH